MIPRYVALDYLSSTMTKWTLVLVAANINFCILIHILKTQRVIIFKEKEIDFNFELPLPCVYGLLFISLYKNNFDLLKLYYNSWSYVR